MNLFFFFFGIGEFLLQVMPHISLITFEAKNVEYSPPWRVQQHGHDASRPDFRLHLRLALLDWTQTPRALQGESLWWDQRHPTSVARPRLQMVQTWSWSAADDEVSGAGGGGVLAHL